MVYEYANALVRTSGTNVTAVSSFHLDAANTNPQDIFDPDIASHSAAWATPTADQPVEVTLVGFQDDAGAPLVA